MIGIYMNLGKFTISYDEIISVDNLLNAWREFLCGKRGKVDVQEFGLHLMDNILSLHHDLVSSSYRHGNYQMFRVNDPKSRVIHKASVRDRVLHRAIYRKLYPLFDKTFVYDSYSCRVGKGTHKAMNQFRRYCDLASGLGSRTCWVLKCDIRKFFASIDHGILISLISAEIEDKCVVELLENITNSFEIEIGQGIPLGNLTSQLFSNIYLHELDIFMKQEMEIERYVRYADDFVIVSSDKIKLSGLIPKIEEFLLKKLKLRLHPDKVSLKTIASGVDFIGWVHFPNHRVLRTSTKRRMLSRLTVNPSRPVLSSYLGMLSYGNTKNLRGIVDGLDIGK